MMAPSERPNGGLVEADAVSSAASVVTLLRRLVVERDGTGRVAVRWEDLDVPDDAA